MTRDAAPADDPPWVPRDLAFGSEAEWAKTSDCYGPSTSTPRTLKALFSPEPDALKRAERWLYSALFHQGGRFEATVKAAPLVIEIATHPATPAASRRFLCAYVTALAYGFAEELPYRGVDPARRMALLEEATRRPAPGEAPKKRIGPRLEPYCDLKTARRLYRAILERRAALYPLIEDADAAVAAAARVAVSLLAADDAALRARFAALLARDADALAARGAPADPEPTVALIIGAATMARATGGPKPEALIAPWGEAASPRLRFAAAIALAEPESIAAHRAALTEGLAAPARRQTTRPPLERVWTSLESLAMALVFDGLSQAAEAETALWLDGFAANLDVRDVDRALRSAQLILALLSPSREARFRDIPAQALTPLQRRALTAILERGLWSLSDGGEFLNFTQLIRAYGLPGDRAGLAAYLAGGESG